MASSFGGGAPLHLKDIVIADHPHEILGLNTLPFNPSMMPYGHLHNFNPHAEFSMLGAAPAEHLLLPRPMPKWTYPPELRDHVPEWNPAKGIEDTVHAARNLSLLTMRPESIIPLHDGGIVSSVTYTTQENPPASTGGTWG